MQGRARTLILASTARAVRQNGMKKECASWAVSCAAAPCSAGASASHSRQPPRRTRSAPAADAWLGTRRCPPLRQRRAAPEGQLPSSG